MNLRVRMSGFGEVSPAKTPAPPVRRESRVRDAVSVQKGRAGTSERRKARARAEF